MEMTPESIVRFLGGEWVERPGEAKAHTPVSTISIDSRTLCPGDLFWAIKGERFDGHDFVEEAFKKGALAAVTSRAVCMPSGQGRPLIRIRDTLEGLQRFAAIWRDQHRCKVVAVTGSSGKTTTKELMAGILTQKYHCLSTQGNMNNLIGVSLTLLRMRDMHEVAVLELGMNHRGEIAQLTALVKPAIGVITNIGRAHIGLLGSVNQIIDAKAELLEGMGPEGLAVLNRDDPYFYILARKCLNGIVTIGESEGADFRILNCELLPQEGRTVVTMQAQGKTLSFSLPVLGRMIAYNLLMAIAVAVRLGCGHKEIESGIAAFNPISSRMDHRMVGGIHLLDDAYNANPESMHAALSTLVECKGNAHCMAILGDMLELGDQTECLHRQLGQWIGHNRKVDFLITYGHYAAQMAQEAVKTGYPARRVWSCDTHEEVSLLASSLLEPGDWVLVKGSRKMGLDRVSGRLTELLDTKNGAKKRLYHKEGQQECSTI